MAKTPLQEYKHKYYLENKEKILAHINKYRKEHPEKIIIKPGYFSKYWEEVREKFFSIYGDTCSCCGETNHTFLVLDHLNGSNRRIKDKRKSYLDAIKNYDPNEYRTLCHNCNQATIGGRICPHQLQGDLTMNKLFSINEVKYG
jgi:hypothetical protein